MNYRHAFHAGNFADVLKHAVLARLIERLKEKEAPFRVIDTHAGIGLYDLTGEEATRTGEWREGIGRLYDRALEPSLAAQFAPYLASVRAANGGGALRRYPGSPWIARHLMREEDRLTATELHPEDARTLAAQFARDRRIKVIALDGWLALGSFVPPKERRGIVLVDPPFEEQGEFDRLAARFADSYRRWPTGIFCLWYPVKDLAAIDRFRLALSTSGIKRILRAELLVRGRATAGKFNGAGLVICNPPWQFGDTLVAMLAALKPILASGPGAATIIDPISGE